MCFATALILNDIVLLPSADVLHSLKESSFISLSPSALYRIVAMVMSYIQSVPATDLKSWLQPIDSSNGELISVSSYSSLALASRMDLDSKLTKGLFFFKKKQ